MELQWLLLQIFHRGKELSGKRTLERIKGRFSFSAACDCVSAVTVHSLIGTAKSD